jgi:hypothetical protein
VVDEAVPQSWSWADVDPATHPFDPDSVAAVIQALPLAHQRPPTPYVHGPDFSAQCDAADIWASAMTTVLTEHYGQWAFGWRWSAGEGDIDGGPVQSWCCPHHSFGTPERTLEVMREALLEWRSWLEDLAECFDGFLPIPPDDQLATWERAVARLVTVVAVRTRGHSAWYQHCERVLSWFLERAGIPLARHSELIDGAIGGRFASWAEPDLVTTEAIAKDLATSLTAGSDG